MAIVTYSWNPDFDFFNKVINLTTAGDQGVPDVAYLNNGFFVATWNDPGNGGDVRGNLVTENGTLFSGSDVNFSYPGTAGAQFDSSVAGFAGGGMIVVYVDASSDPGGDIRFGQGGPVSPGLAVAVGAEDDSQPDVAALADGGIVVTWTRSLGANGSQVVYEVFNHAGSVRTFETVVSVGTFFFQSEDSTVAALTGGGFVVAWEERTYQLAGTIIGEDEVLFRRIDANGVALDAPPVLADTTGSVNRDVQVLGLQDGGFVLAYTDNEFGAGTDIHVRIFNADGSERIDLGRINNFTAGDQDKPTLALLSNGFFVVGWQNQGGLKMQAFDPEGNEIAGEHQDAFSSMIDAEIAGLADGRLVNVRSTTAGDGSGTSIRAQASDLVRTSTGDATDEALVGDALIDVMTGGDGNDTLTGGAAGDTLDGGTGDDVLDGGEGDDVVIGGDGNDRIIAALGAGNDAYDGGGGIDTIVFSSATEAVAVDLSAAADQATGAEIGTDQIVGVENVTGGAGNDTITGDGLSNVLIGAGGNDLVQGLGEADRLDGRTGADTLQGGDGEDTLQGGTGDDRLAGGLGNDTLVGGAGNDALLGQSGDDSLRGAGGDDSLDGGGGLDRLVAGAGNDTLDGGPGSDTLIGGADADRFVFSPGDGTARITDFEDGIDRIDLTAFGFASVAEARAFAANVGSDVVFTFAGGEVLIVEDITKVQLTSFDILV
jgi:Ca2+-binding RTX toxin-like protein